MHFSFFLTTRSVSPNEDKVVLDTTIEYARRAEELGFQHHEVVSSFWLCSLRRSSFVLPLLDPTL
jgi:hypothetical protein